MNEILNGIKILKLYAWEVSFKDMAMSFREREIRSFKSMAYLGAVMVSVMACTPFFVGLASFAAYLLIDSNNVLNANKAFVSLSLFNILRQPMGFLPMVLSMGAMFLVSVRRINKFLNSDEIDANAISHNKPNIDAPVIIESASFSWDKVDSEPTLRNISIKIEKNKLVAIVGSVGSGKSSLLSAILGDMEMIDGSVNSYGSVAYVPQQAWIQNATLRANITFTNDFADKHYKQVLNCCALEPDLEILSASDLTEIGENGINLSGGQKQRVSLARAVYSNSDIYLLDDPLSAVDAHVGTHLFEKVIGTDGILKDKTRVLVTHRLSVLPKVDQIIVMKSGRVSEIGSYDYLIAQKGPFAELIAEYLSSEQSDTDMEGKELTKSVKTVIEKQTQIIKKRSVSRSISNASSDINSCQISDQKILNPTEISGKLIESETTETGSVKFDVYKKYLQSIGKFLSVFVFSAFILSNAFQFGSSVWLSDWSNDAIDKTATNDTKRRDVRLAVYAGIGCLEAIFSLLAAISVNIAGVNASKLIHNNMLTNIIRAPMSFFDTTPNGRILNRFSKDIDTVDSVLALNLRATVNQFFKALFSVAMISLQNALLLVAFFPLAIIYYFVQRLYLSTSRQLKRIDSTTRSPIYNHFSETVSGSASIRAYGVCDQFIQQSNRRIDENNACYYPSFTASRWLAVRLEFIGYTIVFLSALFAVISRGKLSPGITGLSLSYSLSITTILGVLVKTLAEIETNIVSIERCLEYTQTPKEAEWINETTKPSDEWPQNGLIKFVNYSARYREGLDLVLKDITIEINAHSKVGIVGRTGAGKSSLTLALFRLIEPQSGTIIIDGIDITKLGLYDLRSKLTIIPQEPMLFTGTLRTNLDPLSHYSDHEIWNALELSHLKEFVCTLENGINHEITESGDNLSVGQKQLVCLSRALLRNTKILVLDEATAAVDMETDEMIQQTIRNSFNWCTIVTIAHRLNSVIDYDRILVLDNGVIAEFDSPNALLTDNKSILYSLAKQANII